MRRLEEEKKKNLFNLFHSASSLILGYNSSQESNSNATVAVAPQQTPSPEANGGRSEEREEAKRSTDQDQPPLIDLDFPEERGKSSFGHNRMMQEDGSKYGKGQWVSRVNEEKKDFFFLATFP